MTLRLSLLLTLGLLSGLTPFAIDLYLPGLPAIARDLHSSAEAAQLSVTVYLGVFAVGQLLAGPLSDVLGRRRTILLGMLLFLAATLGCAAAPTMAWMLATRALQALGASAVAVTVPALVRDLFERDDYARTMSLVMMTMALAPLVAPTLGGYVVSGWGWRWVFALLAVIAVVAAALFLAQVPETLPAERRHRFDLGQIGRNYLRLLLHRAGFGYMLAGAFSFSGMMTFIVTSPYVYIELYGVAVRHFGLLFSVNVLFAVSFSALNARLVSRLGAERLLRVGLTIQFLGALLLGAVALGGRPPLALVAMAVGCFVAMMGLVLGNSLAGAMAYFPRLAGTASAFAGTLRFGLGAVVGTLVSVLHDGTAAPMLLGMGACGVLAGASYLLLCRPARIAAERGGT